MSTLYCAELEGNLMFKKLKRKLSKFFIEAEKYRVNGPSRHMKDVEFQTGVNFKYLSNLHLCLKKMLRDVINTDDKRNRAFYLKRTYEWFIT